MELVLFTGCFTVKMHNKWFLWKFSVWNASCDTSKQLQVDVVPNLQTICKSVEVFCHILAVSLISLNHVVISFLFRIKKKCLFIFEYYIKYFFKSLFTCTGYFSSIWSSFLIFWKITSLKNMTATLHYQVNGSLCVENEYSNCGFFFVFFFRMPDICLMCLYWQTEKTNIFKSDTW